MWKLPNPSNLLSLWDSFLDGRALPLECSGGNFLLTPSRTKSKGEASLHLWVLTTLAAELTAEVGFRP